jgi:thiol-disulfide isomerase/thioredoxin
MNYRLRVMFLLLLPVFFSASALSQKVFHVSLKFPAGLDTNKIKIRIDNGKGERRIIPSFVENQVTISDNFYSEYAYINCTYPSGNNFYPYSNSFFVWDIPASIIFTLNNYDSLKNPFSNCTLVNTYEIAKIKEVEQLNLFTSVESNDLKNFLNRIGDKLYTDDSLRAIANSKGRKISDKKIEFIRQNGSSYYSLWLFRSELINILSADTMLKIYESAFTGELKNSFEGKEIETILKGRIHIVKSNPAPYFKSFDINNKIVDLGDFKGKYIILNFWASWCVPCIAEMPILKGLNDKYADKLVLISISRDHDISLFKEAVKKNKMEWINIFNDQNLENLYGRKGPIPQVYLINSDGDLIYNNEEENDYELKKLIDILKTNLE